MLQENVNEPSKKMTLSSSLPAQPDNGPTSGEQQQLSKQPNIHPKNASTLTTNEYDVGVCSGNMAYGSGEPRLFDNFPSKVESTTTFGNYSDQASLNPPEVAQRKFRQFLPYSPKTSSSVGWTNQPRKGNCIYSCSGRACSFAS